ncbi:hypothetical protein GGR52DRAFT_403355 [Hypoxylon sp. FL1284]|nr:hypothetical protein GGR52DRAFT_403355 [Hypoxylon sp. FL1284]
MADLMRISRPWLLPTRMVWRAPSPVLCGLYRTTTIPLRQYSTRRPTRNSDSARAKLFNVNQRKDDLINMQANMTILIPETLVAPPLSRYPRQPSKFFDMLWLHIRARAQAFWAVLGMKLSSQPRIFITKPLFKFHKSAAIPAAKALHVRMSEAMAVGDKDSLRHICTPELFTTLASTIDARPRGTRVQWELVKYDQQWRHPRIADWRVGYQPGFDGGVRTLKQVVVTISSVQRVTRYDDTQRGAKVPGSERVRHMTEHLVLQAQVDNVTYEAGPWKIWGTLSESTYEAYKAEVENIRALSLEQTKMP